MCSHSVITLIEPVIKSWRQGRTEGKERCMEWLTGQERGWRRWTERDGGSLFTVRINAALWRHRRRASLWTRSNSAAAAVCLSDSPSVCLLFMFTRWAAINHTFVEVYHHGWDQTGRFLIYNHQDDTMPTRLKGFFHSNVCERKTLSYDDHVFRATVESTRVCKWHGIKFTLCIRPRVFMWGLLCSKFSTLMGCKVTIACIIWYMISVKLTAIFPPICTSRLHNH